MVACLWRLRCATWARAMTRAWRRETCAADLPCMRDLLPDPSLYAVCAYSGADVGEAWFGPLWPASMVLIGSTHRCRRPGHRVQAGRGVRHQRPAAGHGAGDPVTRPAVPVRSPSSHALCLRPQMPLAGCLAIAAEGIKSQWCHAVMPVGCTARLYHVDGRHVCGPHLRVRRRCLAVWSACPARRRLRRRPSRRYRRRPSAHSLSPRSQAQTARCRGRRRSAQDGHHSAQA